MFSSSLMDPVKQVLHLAVDYGVPRNGFIAVVSGVVGWWTPLAVQWHGGPEVKARYESQFGVNPWTFVTGPIFGQTAVNKGAEWTGYYTALATSITLNLIAQYIFKAEKKEVKEGIKENLMEMTRHWRKPVYQDDLKSLTEALPPAPYIPESSDFVEHYPQKEQQIHLPSQQQPVSVKPSIELPPTEKPVEKTVDDLQELLEELDPPCCGQILAIFKRIWENDKPDSVYRRQNAGMQSFI